ncbi:EscJ/YscJ/HrcJ family type III secretion inner membrane ring protein [Salmonella enterica subsp. enterica]|nr:EscJ/YscJ/HrcJ family type III secretion inner membrane ring protein [Salmonella enterica subsp. enterica serovar Bonn]EBZ5939313.1 EscJ/YscJ/HrcJ family type III secretion inner membrane ring protein [Salmonella enterica subsp. enterica serovar Muenchen]MLZ41056.1 EscJ/YscJ/HrcJ family type III secretion inner membrane ring protein [Salmonella enterica subsp. enterica serovar Bonn]
MSMVRSGIVFLVVLILAGCRVDLYGNLSENDANHMLALLLSNKISAEKKSDKANGFSLAVDENDFVKAIEVLRQNGYPRKDFRSVEELFPSGQLVTSPMQEAEKIKFLQQQSLEKMLTDVEGVINANVVIGRLENQDSRSNASARQTVSVLIKHTPEVNVKSYAFQIKNLVRNAMPGTRDEDLSLVIQPVNYRINPNLKTTGMRTSHDSPSSVVPETGIASEVPASDHKDDLISEKNGVKGGSSVPDTAEISKGNITHPQKKATVDVNTEKQIKAAPGKNVAAKNKGK